MNTLRLKPGTYFAPASVPFTDPRTGRKFDAYELSIDGALAQIINHRRKNPAVYPPGEPVWFDEAEVRQEFLRHLLPKRPDLFAGVNGVVTAPVPTVRMCRCGSTDLEDVFCPTCSGRKITGFKCKTCGTVTYT